MNVAVIGDADTTTGFRLAGITAVYEAKSQTAPQVLEKVLTEDYDIIIITESLAAFAEEQLSEVRGKATPVIVEIPDKKGSIGYTKKILKEVIKNAVGVDITLRRGES